MHAGSLLEGISGSPFGCIGRCSENKETGQRENLSCNAGLTKAPVYYTGSSGTEMGLQRCPELRQEAGAFITWHQSHWIKAWPGEGV